MATTQTSTTFTWGTYYMPLKYPARLVGPRITMDDLFADYQRAYNQSKETGGFIVFDPVVDSRRYNGTI